VDFELTEQQLNTQEWIRRISEEEIEPRAHEFEINRKIPEDVLRRLAALKMMGITVPVELGGGGMDHVSYVLILKEVSKACASTGQVMAANNSLYCFPILSSGTKEQKNKYLYPCASGEKIGCCGLAETEMGFDDDHMKATAVRHKGEWVINGQKDFVVNANVASFCVLSSVTEDESGRRDVSLFVLDLQDLPGFRAGRLVEKLGLTASGSAQLIFEDVRAPADALLGNQGNGLRQIASILEGSCIAAASQAIGIGRAVLEEAVEYSKIQDLSGKPISSSQTVQWKLANMALELDAAELITLKAAWLKDQKKPYEKEAAMAKMYASDAGMKAAIDGIQIFGDNGYSRDYSMERHMRDAKMFQVYYSLNENVRKEIAGHLIKGL
jgi:alkylation response protein AidB-like acyl-CoA dehydrogenase